MIKFLNAIVTKLDEEAWRFLKPHENKIICFEITDIRTLYFQIKPDGLESVQVADGTLIHTTFKGTLASFIKMGYSKQGVHNDLHIRGDLECAKALYDTWQYLECDWEDALADLTHPTLAHGLFSGLKQGKEWLKQTYVHRSHDLSAYLQDEIQFLPTQAEVDELFKNIETCRDDVERLEANITLYIENNKGLST